MFVLIVLLSIVFSWVVRKNSKAGIIIAKGLAIVLLVNQAIYIPYCLAQKPIEWFRVLPMELCEWITFTAVFALWTRKQIFFVLTYFWGMAGTLQATITPDLAYDIPHMFFFVFFISHVSILVAAMMLTFGFKMRPQPKSIWIAFLMLQGYLAVTMLVNWIFDTNYGYLCQKPLNPTLFDHLGPWPWYILSLELIAILSFCILYLPFSILDWIRDRNSFKKS